MAEASNGLNFMAMLNPQFAAQQQKFALQQQMAQQMMQQGSEQPPTAQLANPGGQVIKNSPWAALAGAVEKGTGAYLSNKAIGDQLAAYQNMGNSSGIMGSTDPLMPTQQELLVGQLSPEQGKAMYEARTSGIKARNAAQGDTVTDANGNILPKSNFLGGGSVPVPPAAPASTVTPTPSGNLPPPQPSIQSTAPTGNPNMTGPQQNAAITDLYGDKPSPDNAMPNAIPGTTPGVPAKSPDVPMAMDGKPVIPDLTNYSKDVGAGPKYNTDVTKYGVETSGKLRDADIAAYDKMGTQAENAAQMQGRLGYMEDALKSGNAGNIISQNPDLANKLIAAGVITDKGAINDVSAFQAYEGAQVQEIINQIKSASPDSPQSRVLAQEFNALSEKMGNPSQRPEAIHEIMAMSQGFANWNKDMVTQYHDMGGLDNRNANKATLRPVDYKIGFGKDHPVYDYIKMARDEIGPFKGMAGNNGEAPIIGTISKGHKFLGGDPSKPESWSKLP